MAAALERLLSDRALAEGCGMAAYAKARRQYDTSVVLPRMMEAYEAAAHFFYGDRDVPAQLKPKRTRLRLRTAERELASVA
jgi:hypothetical protein